MRGPAARAACSASGRAAGAAGRPVHRRVRRASRSSSRHHDRAAPPSEPATEQHGCPDSAPHGKRTRSATARRRPPGRSAGQRSASWAGGGEVPGQGSTGLPPTHPRSGGSPSCPRQTATRRCTMSGHQPADPDRVERPSGTSRECLGILSDPPGGQRRATGASRASVPIGRLGQLRRRPAADNQSGTKRLLAARASSDQRGVVQGSQARATDGQPGAEVGGEVAQRHPVGTDSTSSPPALDQGEPPGSPADSRMEPRRSSAAVNSCMAQRRCQRLRESARPAGDPVNASPSARSSSPSAVPVCAGCTPPRRFLAHAGRGRPGRRRDGLADAGVGAGDDEDAHGCVREHFQRTSGAAPSRRRSARPGRSGSRDVPAGTVGGRNSRPATARPGAGVRGGQRDLGFAEDHRYHRGRGASATPQMGASARAWRNTAAAPRFGDEPTQAAKAAPTTAGASPVSKMKVRAASIR